MYHTILRPQRHPIVCVVTLCAASTIIAYTHRSNGHEGSPSKMHTACVASSLCVTTRQSSIAASSTHRLQVKWPQLLVESIHKYMLCCRNEKNVSSCALDVIVLTETVSHEDVLGLLPVNTMRNYALALVKTPLVAMVDVDLLPSASLHEWLLQPTK